MKRTICIGLLAFGTIMAQAPAPAPAAPAAPKGPAPKSQGEIEALQALGAAATDPDKAIAAAENLITKFADTDFKGIALFVEADAYERKKDYNRMEIFAERALEADPKNFQAALMLARHFATHTGANDLDKDEKLGKGEKYANQVIQMMPTMPKPNPQIPDEQWEAAKKDSVAEAYNDIGLGNLTAKKYDVAVTNFKKAVDSTSQPEPAYMVRLASAYLQGGKNAEAVEWSDKVLAVPEVHPQIKQLATQIKTQAAAAKK
ncbi:MAG: tetratricopeptide repeat protein [Candidatus Solibacter sp.]